MGVRNRVGHGIVPLLVPPIVPVVPGPRTPRRAHYLLRQLHGEPVELVVRKMREPRTGEEQAPCANGDEMSLLLAW